MKRPIKFRGQRTDNGETEEMKICVLFASYRSIEKKEFDTINNKIAKLGYKFDWESQS